MRSAPSGGPSPSLPRSLPALLGLSSFVRPPSVLVLPRFFFLLRPFRGMLLAGSLACPSCHADLARARVFSVRLLKVCEVLFRDPGCSRRFVEGLAAAGTAIGQNLSEAQSSVSRRQMAQCYRVALRESREARHSLQVIQDLRRATPRKSRGSPARPTSSSPCSLPRSAASTPPGRRSTAAWCLSRIPSPLFLPFPLVLRPHLLRPPSCSSAPPSSLLSPPSSPVRHEFLPKDSRISCSSADPWPLAQTWDACASRGCWCCWGG